MSGWLPTPLMVRGGLGAWERGPPRSLAKTLGSSWPLEEVSRQNPLQGRQVRVGKTQERGWRGRAVSAEGTRLGGTWDAAKSLTTSPEPDTPRHPIRPSHVWKTHVHTKPVHAHLYSSTIHQIPAEGWEHQLSKELMGNMTWSTHTWSTAKPRQGPGPWLTDDPEHTVLSETPDTASHST